MGATMASGQNVKMATRDSFTKKVLAKIAGIGRNKMAGKPLPSLYIEFRKKGRPINPAPWWSKATGKIGKEKV